MICPRCYGKGRMVGETTFWQGGSNVAVIPEISLCPTCDGHGVLYCCDGDQSQPDRASAMLHACDTDVNPNEAS